MEALAGPVRRKNLVPAQGRVPAALRLARFQEQAEAVSCTVERLTDAGEVPGAVAAYLREHNLPPSLALAPEPWLAELPWDNEPLLGLEKGAVAATELFGLQPTLRRSSTDSNIPISLGIPAITIGGGGSGGGGHSPGEWFINENGPRGIQRALLILVAQAGLAPIS